MSVGQSERSGMTAEVVPAGSASTRPARGPRVRQIDALRVLSCLSVITVHAVGGPYPPDSVGLGQTSFLLHYSREVFFFVSALVLVRTYHPRVGPDGRLPDENAFRRRRLRMVGVPYLWWTTIYFAVSIYHTRGTEPLGPMLDDLPLRWLYLVVTGNGCYHMYFLLVTLQFAVAFPLMLRLLRWTSGGRYRQAVVLAVSAVAQVATLTCYQWFFLPDDGWRGLLGDASLPAYQFWMVAGAVAGLNLEQWHAWVMKHKGLVLGAIPVSAAILLWTYRFQLPSRGALGASSPLQPVMVLWSVAALGGLYLLSVWIMERGPKPVRSVFSYGAQLSFGVYLAHPMVLDLVLSIMRRLGVMAPSVWVSLVALVSTVAISSAVCAGLHRTRLSLPLMGRGQLVTATEPAAGPVRALAARLSTRRVAVPAAVLALSLLAALMVSADRTSPTQAGTPTWQETVEASTPRPPSDGPDCADDDTVSETEVVDCASGVPEASSGASASTGTVPPADSSH